MLYARQWELHPALPYVAEWTTTARLATQIDRWRALAAAAIEPNPFYEPEFLLASAEHIEKAEIRCIAIYSDGAHDSDLIGLFPMKRAQIMPGLPLPALEFYRNIYCTLTVPLIAGFDPAGVWRCFLDALARTEGAARTLLAPCMPSGRAAFAALETTLAATDRAMEIVHRHNRAAVANVTSFARYIEQYGTKRNKDIRRRERRLHELGTVDMRTVRDPEGKRAALAEFLRIEASGWKGQEGSAMACSPASKALAEATFLADCAEFDVLSVDGKAITVNANLLRNGVLFTMKTAYDEAFHQFSPGIMLDLYHIRNLAEQPERYTRIDSLAIPGHPIESRWCDKEEIASLVIDTTEHAGPSHARTMAGVLRGIGQIKSWVKEQIAARKG
ncbi:MAG: GNAT family N-acetyltransferase [Proteobacteria bacterium]|nr:GNAT family N-acetyltransferase [Pseudomonadota bacterium]